MDYNKEIKLFHTASAGENNYDKNSIASQWMDKEMKDPTILQTMPMVCLTWAMIEV